MSMQITQTGLQASANAGAGGFKINVNRFSVTEFPDVNPQVTDTALAGVPVHSGNISVIECLDNATVQFTITIPAKVPETGSWRLTEIGLYLDSGELFARGDILPVYDKTGDVATSLYVIVTALGLPGTLNVDITTDVSVPSVSRVNDLPDPTSVYQNTFAVLDQMYNSDGSFSPAAAIKYGPGGAHWGFMGYDRVYTGPAGNVTDESTFNLSPRNNGFHLETGEQVIVQLTSVGTSGKSGEVRRAKFDGRGQFVLDLGSPFSGFDDSCIISLWKREVPANLISNTIPIPRHYVKRSDGKLKTITLPFIPVSDDYVWLFVNGLFQHKSAYELIGNRIQLFESPQEGQDVNVEAFELTTGGAGVVLGVYQFEFEIVRPTTEFKLPFAPKTKTYCMVFIGGVFQSRTSWDLRTDTIVFEDTVDSSMRAIQVVIFDEMPWTNHNLQIIGYTERTKGFSLVQLATPEARPLDQSLAFLGSVFQSDSNYNQMDDFLQFTGGVPGKVNLQLMEFHKAPPQRLYALKSEVDRSLRDVYVLGNYVMRFVRNDGRYFDLSLAYNKGSGQGTLVLDKSSVSTNSTGTLFIYGGKPGGYVQFTSEDSTVAAVLNSGTPTLDAAGNWSVQFQPAGVSRSITISAQVDGKFIGSVRLDIVQNASGASLMVNGTTRTIVTPSTVLVYRLRNAPASVSIKLVSSEGEEVEIGYTGQNGELEYIMQYPVQQFGKSRSISVTAIVIETNAPVGTVNLTMVNSGALFLVEGGVLQTIRPGESISFSVIGAEPDQTVTWLYTDSMGPQSVQVGTTDSFGVWSAVKPADVFNTVKANKVDISCQVGSAIIGVVTLRLLNSSSFLVDSETTAVFHRNSRHLFEIHNADPDAQVYWVSSDNDSAKNLIGKTNENGYLSFQKVYGADLGEDRTVTYTAYVNDNPTNSVAIQIENPIPEVFVNGLPSTLIYPNTTLIYTVSNASPNSAITIIIEGENIMQPVGHADSLGDLTWTESFSAAQIENGKTYTITVLSNGEPIGTVDLSMRLNNAARMLANGAHAAIVGHNSQITFEVQNGEVGMPVKIVDTEGHVYGSGLVGTNGTFSVTQQYGTGIGVDRTLTVYANSENVILDSVQLAVINNIGTSTRFRAKGVVHASVLDGEEVIFTITGAKPGALIQWSIPGWNLALTPIGNVDRNGNLAHSFKFDADMFITTGPVSIEAQADNVFVGSVTITLAI